MKLSARNVLKGKLVGIDKGKVTAVVKVDIGGGNMITSSITLAALEDLKLKKGSEGSGHHQWVFCAFRCLDTAKTQTGHQALGSFAFG
jgi:molybdopterin-binding protein